MTSTAGTPAALASSRARATRTRRARRARRRADRLRGLRRTASRRVLLLPTWSIVHSRHWKAQIPYLARHFRVVTFDGRGNGRSDRPRGAAAYADDASSSRTRSPCMDATGDRAARCSWRLSLRRAVGDAARRRPPRARRRRVACIGPAVPLAPGHPERDVSAASTSELDTDEGWAKYNRHYWRARLRGLPRVLLRADVPEPHSTKQIEDCVGWGLETDPGRCWPTRCRRSRSAEPERRGVCRARALPGAGHPRRPRR